MSGGGFAWATVAGSGVVMLLLSAYQHLAHPQPINRLTDHSLPLQGSGLGMLEGMVGLFALAAIVAPNRLGSIGFAPMGMLGVSYSIWTAYHFARKPSIPCGCSPQDISTNFLSVVRALWVIGAAAGGTVSVAIGDGLQIVVTCLAAVALGALVYAFPGSMTDPYKLVDRETGWS